MTFTLEVHPEADAEHAQTITWLGEHAGADAAERYASTIERSLDEIVASPFAWPRWLHRTDVHVRHLREITYSVFYRVRQQVVTIIAFAHMSRSPGYWLSRLG